MGFAFLAAIFVVILVWSNVNAKLAHKGCNIFQGDWVLDNSSYPYYETSQCPFIEDQFDCHKLGRRDKEYTKYKWQPAGGCVLPRLNALDFLKKLKGKQLMFVGDSLSLNQWQSLTCMLHVALPKAKYTSYTNQGISNFTFHDYNVSLLFFRNAYLVDYIVNEARGRVMRLDSIKSSKIWGGMDYVIFDTWHWWLKNGTKQPWDWIVYGNTTLRDMDRMTAYEKALNTWAKWVDSHINPVKTQVFFQGVSPDHDGGGQGSDEQSCVGQTRPLKRPGSSHPAEEVLEKVLKAMSKPIYLLDITRLSQLRIDGHPGPKGPGRTDCTHWCLSGVPDIWNEMLYALIN